jgi:predicted ester cyclase
MSIGQDDLEQCLREFNSLNDDCTAIIRSLNNELSNFPELKTEAATLAEALNEVSERLSFEKSALGEIIDIYAKAERLSMLTVESLPVSLPKHGVVTEAWLATLI